jgi:hypothetical protein
MLDPSPFKGEFLVCLMIRRYHPFRQDAARSPFPNQTSDTQAQIPVHLTDTPPLRWPQTLRAKVQDYLTLGWTVRLPFIQHIAPCKLAAQTLTRVLGARIADYTYVDFASGSGGPTPFFEQHVNAQLTHEGKPPVSFVLSDIAPHVQAWRSLAKKSEYLGFVERSVDATCAPERGVMLEGVPGAEKRGVMRLFSLAFHHFDNELAVAVLRNTMLTSEGFW